MVYNGWSLIIVHYGLKMIISNFSILLQSRTIKIKDEIKYCNYYHFINDVLLVQFVGQRLCMIFSISIANFLPTLHSHLDVTYSHNF